MRLWNRGLCDPVARLREGTEEERNEAIAEASRSCFFPLVLLGLGWLMIAGLASLLIGRMCVSVIARSVSPRDGAMIIAARWLIPMLFMVFAAIPLLWLRRAALRRELRRLHLRGCCPTCGYDLHGIGQTEGRVTCPECATSVSPAEAGLSGTDRHTDAPRLPKAWGNRGDGGPRA